MARLRKLSGREMAKALSKLGFEARRQRGSHLTMIKETTEGKRGCVVPMHKVIKNDNFEATLY